jgi:hypothetical protein
MGIRLSIPFNLVYMGSCTDLCAIILGASTFTHLHSAMLKVPFPSIGTPNTSTTQPNKAFPTRTFTIDPMHLIISPSLMVVSLPNITIPTFSF